MTSASANSRMSAAIVAPWPLGDVGVDTGRARAIDPMRSWRPEVAVPVIARLAMFANVISLKRLPGLLAAMTSGAAPKLAAGDANAASLISGAATVQACGTDNLPTVAARPSPAATAGTSAGPNAVTGRVNPLSTTGSSGTCQPLALNVAKIFSSLLLNASSRSSSSSNVKSVNKPVVFNGVSPAWATPGKNRMIPARSDSVLRSDPDAAVVAAVDVSPCSAVGIAWDAAACVLVAADGPVVVCGAGVNGGSVVADADAPA